jgi:hypothetical protein
MAVKDTVKGLVLTNFDTAGLTGNQQPINPNGFEEAPFLIRIINDSDADVFISYDGVNDTDLVRPGDIIQLNAQTNSQPGNHVCLFAKGSIVYVSGPVVGVGAIYLAAYSQIVQR